MSDTKKVLIEVEVPTASGPYAADELLALAYLRNFPARIIDPGHVVPEGWRLREIIEVLAGLEGFIPETAAEGYLQRALKQIEDIAATTSAGVPECAHVEHGRAVDPMDNSPYGPDICQQCGAEREHIDVACYAYGAHVLESLALRYAEKKDMEFFGSEIADDLRQRARLYDELL